MKQENLTGYPSIDKPWLKYYSEEAINAPLPDGSMYDYMTACNAGRLDEPALNYFGRKITHRQLQTEIDRCARALIACGIKAGDVVSLCLLAIPEAVYLLYAVNKLGAVANFLVLNATPQELYEQIAAAKSRVVITVDIAENQIAEAVKNSCAEHVVSVSLAQSMPPVTAAIFRLKSKSAPSALTPWNSFMEAGKNVDAAYPDVAKESAAVIEYTGGTTGKSKGVVLSNLSLNAVAFHYRHTEGLFDFQAGERFLCCVPPFLAVGLSVCYHMPLCIGFELILSPDPSPQVAPLFIKKYRPNHVLTGALHIDQIVSDKSMDKIDFSFLSTIACGGDKKSAVWEESASQFFLSHHAQHPLINGYGLSETAGSFCTTMHHSDQMLPFVYNNMMIIDTETGKELTYGNEGEVLVSGPSLMLGYYGENSNLDSNTFCLINGEKWLHTGDLGTISEDGYFAITGRIKRLLWAMGEDHVVNKIYPMQIEEIILQDKAVKQCAVVGLPNAEKGFLPVAFIVLHETSENHDAVAERIQNICRQNLKANSQPHMLRFVETLPYTRAGKVDFRALERKAERKENL